MEININEILMKSSFVKEIKINQNFPLELKLKIFYFIIFTNKIRKDFDECCQEFIKKLKPNNFERLKGIELENITKTIIEEYNLFLIEKGKEKINFFNLEFNEEEFSYILDSNCDRDIILNDNKLKAMEFLQIIYSLFVDSKSLKCQKNGGRIVRRK